MQQQVVGHISVNGIIYRTAYPEEIFTDIKDATYPLVVWRGCICLIGGNWTGNSSKHDQSPLATFTREIMEELILKKSIRNTAELGETCIHTDPINYLVQDIKRRPTPEDEADLQFVKEAMVNGARSFDDYIITIPREVFLRADSETKQTTITALTCVFEIGLDEEIWRILARLQQDFDNLSCESESHILSVDGMIEKNIIAMSGQDQILQEFFEAKGVTRGRTLPRDTAITVQRAVVYPRSSYKEYVKYYTILKKPEGW